MRAEGLSGDMMAGAAVHPAFAVGLGGFDWIEANAGSGKTWTITALVARAIVEREADPRGIVVITFTRAAAAELRMRVRERLADLRAALDAALAGAAALEAIDDAFARPYAESIASQGAPQLARAQRLVRAALASIDEMTVTTIHGFAQRLLAEFGASFGAPDDARFGADLSDLMERVQAGFWRSLTAQGPSALVDAIGAQCWVVQAARRRLDAALRQPLARVEPQPGCAVRSAEQWRAAWHAVRGLWPLHGAALVDAIDAHPKVNRKKFQRRWVESHSRALEAICARPDPWAKPYGRTLDELAHYTTEGIAYFLKDGARLDAPPALAQTIDAIDTLHAAAHTFWAEAPDALACAWREAARSALAEAKHRAQRFDHDDALRLLADGLDAASGTDLAARIAARHPYLFLDEAQDTDPLQWSVIERIWLATPRDVRRGALVAVGDPKQAIYAFRDADVYAYLAAKERWRPALHTLADNRRSAPALVQGVNSLFSGVHAFVEPRIDYVGSTSPHGHDAGTLLDPHDPLAAGCRGAPLRIVRFDDAQSALRVGWMADEIARLLCPMRGARLRGADGHTTLLRPQDIGVLVRTAAEGEVVRDALRARGIGSVEVSNASVLDTEEARDLQDVIAAIAQPDEPMRIRGALVTPLVAADASAVIDALDGDGAAQRVMQFRALRQCWLASGPLAALRRLTEQAGTAALLAMQPDGERRLVNLHHLMELLQSAMPATRTPQAALVWLANTVTRGTDGVELRLDDDASLVRISTIHKSKGLEYPVVFMPFAPEMSRDPSGRSDGHEYPVWHDEQAGLSAVIDLRTRRPQAIDARIRLERAAEQVRLAYVALTRARLRCTVAWTVDKSSRKSPLAWLLHGVDPLQEDPQFDAAVADEALSALRAVQPGCVAVVAAATTADFAFEPNALSARHETAAPTPAAPSVCATLEALPFSRPIGRPLDRLNFTALNSAGSADVGRAFGLVADSAGGPDPSAAAADVTSIARLLDIAHDALHERDRDALDVADSAAAPTVGRSNAFNFDVEDAPGQSDIRWRFPAGSRAGSCLHEMLETADLRGGVMPNDCEAALRRWGLAEHVVDAASIAEWLDAVLAAPLPLAAPFALRDASARMLREFEFQLPVHTHARVLEPVLRRFGRVQGLGNRTLRGTLRGFIDAVFEHDGRLWVLDWKSSYLGPCAADYEQGALAQAMDEGGYRLQAALYMTAAVRWMRAHRPRWQAARDLGGAIYVFLRGAGAEPGVGFHIERFDAGALDALDGALQAEPIR